MSKTQSTVKKKTSTTAKKSTTSAAVDELVAKLPAEQRELATKLRELVAAAVPEATWAIKWRMPTAEYHGLLCYIRPQKEYLRFGFFEQAVEFDDPAELLEGTGQAMRHVKVRQAKDIRPVFKKWLATAAKINRSK
jgi:hypothetical protein